MTTTGHAVTLAKVRTFVTYASVRRLERSTVPMSINGESHPTIKDAAKKFGVTAKTIDSWIAKGIVALPPSKTRGLREVHIFPPDYLTQAVRDVEHYRRTGEPRYKPVKARRPERRR